MNGIKLRNVVVLMALVFFCAGIFVAQVWKQNTYVRISKDTVRLGREAAALRNEIALLELDVKDLKKIARIESVAKGELGLEYVAAPVLVFADPVERRNRSEGDRLLAGR